MVVALTWFVSYLIGAISFSYLMTKKIKKVDIRQLGSGNAGATNTQRVLGTGPAVTVLLLDVAKGIVAVVLARLLGLDDWAAAAAGLFAILGHNWPVYYGFRGGKGVATTIGVFAVLNVIPTLLAGIITIIVIAVTRYVSLGSLLLITVTPFMTYFYSQDSLSLLIVECLIMVLSYWQHRTNISRLIKGEESKLGQSKKTS
ncbi:glycerol-3-phosphate 1-O-acyltransferase PlsY [Tuberibacillus sp. Marseille-P3662]|uniref:glycerol-3-phosphate 1-O-acyltransferase PlsY n=1 Tax=Tuberibacillus sp. Marseille-P3662 TaxID=1965358 RepID=UPI000A1CE2A2|nr:glycerol-3-phosphate 1-O-acyltransferase PlsY [Tuberibacillus sp. Marseille-P3662]